MFKRLKLRLRDMSTIKKLCIGAERHAHADGEELPGAEHFLLSALDLPDGSAQRVFKRLGAEPGKLRQAIRQQYSDALNDMGINPASLDADLSDSEPIVKKRVLFDSTPSGQAVMQNLVTQRKQDKTTPLLAAHIVSAVASLKHGVVPRSLRAMGIEPETMHKAVEDELNGWYAAN